ncbi:cell cycle control protein cwf19 [Plectosphaerella plurivora]|uniref:Cell cycle control protein cwf19 n=1 Tax=Plectosphaerella plurivora TaxID=936078 RepID=A0A9P9A7I8_9PEZI|nr:cell cycle control protein cwf19 [Plectosphaerella plurivora]
MDGLDEFEKALAAEKGERERTHREKEERRERKKQHRSHHHHRSHHKDDADESSERRGHRDRDNSRERHGHRSSKHRDEDGGHRRHRDSRRRDDDNEENSSRRKRARREENDLVTPEGRSSHDQSSKEDTTNPEEAPVVPIAEPTGASLLKRDDWMTAPSAIDIDYVQRRKKEKTPPPKEAPVRVVHSREINKDFDEVEAEDAPAAERKVDYKFGDRGAQWRMMKLASVYTMVEQTGRTVDDVAVEKYGDLQDFDDAREERTELDRRKLYGEGYEGTDQPTGDLYRERKAKEAVVSEAAAYSDDEPPEQGVVIPDRPSQHTPMDQTTLNRLRAQMVKAKLMRAPNAAQLEEEYNQAAASFATNGPQSVVLGAQESRILAGTRGEVKAVETRRGKERGNVEENTDMTIEDMVREERRTRGQAGGEGMRLAERIAKDAKFDDDLEYMDENADKLAKRVHKSEINLKNVAVGEYQKLTRILDNCPLCHHEDKGQPPLAPVVSLGTRAFLTLPTEPEVGEGGAVIVPLAHRRNLLECDDDEWEEMRNFMKSLTRMYHEKGQDVIFYENAAAPQRHLHAAMMAVPIPYEDGAMIPAYFREAFMSADEEWSQHRKVIDTGARAAEGLGKLAFRRSIAKEMPYFHVWFTLDGGLGHIVENAAKWPRGDLFAREVIGGILDLGPDVIKKQGRWRKDDARVEPFKKRWRKFDWTRVLSGA